MARAAEASAANYAFFIGATNSNLDEILHADYTRIPGVKLFMGSSTGGMLVDNDSEIRRLFTQFHRVIACHAESEGRKHRFGFCAVGHNATVEIDNLIGKRSGMLMSVGVADESRGTALAVAPKHKYIVYAQIGKVYKLVFNLTTAIFATDNMRYRAHTVALADNSGDGNGARTAARRGLPIAAAANVAISHLGAVRGNIDISRIKLHKTV